MGATMFDANQFEAVNAEQLVTSTDRLLHRCEPRVVETAHAETRVMERRDSFAAGLVPMLLVSPVLLALGLVIGYFWPA